MSRTRQKITEISYLLPSRTELQTAEAALGIVQADVLPRFSSAETMDGTILVEMGMKKKGTP